MLFRRDSFYSNVVPAVLPPAQSYAAKILADLEYASVHDLRAGQGRLRSTKFLVTTALDRYVRNPMYIGVAMTILGGL